MAFHNWDVRNLLLILGAGGGLVMEGRSWAVQNLTLLASAAAKGGGHLTLTGMEFWAVQNLTLIAQAGRGHVTFG